MGVSVASCTGSCKMDEDRYRRLARVDLSQTVGIVPLTHRTAEMDPARNAGSSGSLSLMALALWRLALGVFSGADTELQERIGGDEATTNQVEGDLVENSAKAYRRRFEG